MQGSPSEPAWQVMGDRLNFFLRAVPIAGDICTLCVLCRCIKHIRCLKKKGTPATKSHDGGIHLIVPSHSQKVKSNAHRFFLSPWLERFEATWQSQKRYGKSHEKAPGTRLPMFPKALAVHKQCHDCKLQQWSCEFVNPKQTTKTNPTTTNPETKTQSTPKPTPRQHPHARSQYGGTWNRESETYKPAILTRRCSPPANSPHRYQPLCNFNPPEKAPNSQISSTDQFISSFSSLSIFLLTSG